MRLAVKSAQHGARYRLGVASRVAAAALGGYVVAALLAILLALALPMARIDNAITGTLVGITILPFVAIAPFWARSAGRAWAGMILLSLIFGGSAWALGWRP